MEKSSRIIDTHCHAFPQLGNSNVWNQDIHIKMWQNHVRDFTAFWRTRHGKHINKKLLEYGSDDIYKMPNLNFRITTHGRAAITIDRIDCYLQLSLPSLITMEVSPEQLIGEMDVVGAETFTWGSDMPFGSFWCTYKQALDHINLHCDFLTQKDKTLF